MSKAKEILKKYEEWEAKLLMDNEAWENGERPLPKFTQKLWDELLELQKLRNDVLY